MSVIALPSSPPLTPPGVGHTSRRKAAELGAVLTALAAVLVLTPLNSPDYIIPTITAIAGVIVYGIYGLVRIPGAARRWGFIGNPRRAEGVVRGAMWTVGLVVAAFVPVLVIKALIPRPHLLDPRGYLLWCLVQDFVFFALVLRNLLDFLPRHVAVWTSAALFGISHYPFTGFMIATGFMALLWCYIFAESRVLWYITLPHCLFGIIILA